MPFLAKHPKMTPINIKLTATLGSLKRSSIAKLPFSSEINSHVSPKYPSSQAHPYAP